MEENRGLHNCGLLLLLLPRAKEASTMGLASIEEVVASSCFEWKQKRNIPEIISDHRRMFSTHIDLLN